MSASDLNLSHAHAGVLGHLASHPLCGAIAHHCTALASTGIPAIAALNTRLAQCTSPPRSGSGGPIRCVAPDRAALAYEQRVYRHGEVATRPDNWHDCFNVLVWMSFPKTKAALNVLHVERMGDRAANTGRGSVRDAATQFDESGIVVLSSDQSLLDLLAQRAWKALFWERRAAVVAHMRFLVFGHGLYDAMRAPFYRMCGRAALIAVAQDVIDRDGAGQCEFADPILAYRFATGTSYPRPRALLALPILGIPGVTAASECAAYYEDTEQFRPLPAWALPSPPAQRPQGWPR